METEKELIQRVIKIKENLEKKGHCFIPVENEIDHLKEIQDYYFRTKINLSDLGIKRALTANSLTLEWF